MSGLKLFQHQEDALNKVEQFNKVEIKGYEGLYAIDRQGNVYSLLTTTSRRQKILKTHEKNGYLAINLFKDGKMKHYYIHRLVAETFIENSNNYPEVNHIDCNKFNNSVENLEWCDRKHNLKHSYENGLKRKGELHGCHKLTESEVEQIRNIIGQIPQKEIASRYNISQSTVSAIKCGRLWKEGDMICQG